MPKQVRTHMTLLDRGLAIQARKEGLTVDVLCEVFHRDRRTMQELFRRAGCQRRMKFSQNAEADTVNS